ncbi:dihydroxy-acid dehydratase [Sinorhizobium terangae]|uniref:Dihydroxy-acid dehydratase n=1 Tax=Sinorhizobium terangae TaxID=110322 RepID=A0A6N7LEW4_SINTE|nr:L-arabinonate dehydratase [Sinorhizobium terangae]MBB4184473.1 dihydroxy-acid dehydratase [Sinorhizobium terangae]MQX16347.1 dihydroxy-acid dehydratase [Sinorhizobium terangae]
MTGRKKPEEFRSFRWFGVRDLRSFGHRSRLYQMGYDNAEIAGKPVIAIINTWSDINPCHAHLRTRAEEVKRGVWQAGGFPIELPAMSLAETYVKPTTMLYRNFLAMEVEELIRSHPVDGVVLLAGCDKTTPATIMGAIQVDLPTIFVPAGPMLRGNYRGQALGSGSDVWKYWAEKEAGRITEHEWGVMERGIARSFGTCMTMGTASTMTALADTLGLSLPGASGIPAADAGHSRIAALSGARIVGMVFEDLKPSDILTVKAFENALTVHMAMAGSTNAMIHLIAMARRCGVDLTLDDFDRMSEKVPVLCNIRPTGEFLMEDFYYAGGLPALWKQLKPLLHLEERNVVGSIGEAIREVEIHLPDVIRPLDNPVAARGGTAILKGNLAPQGCVMKPAAADPALLKHRGPALVFDDYETMMEAVNDEDLDVTADTVLILRNAGPVGGPGMPEWGMLPIPKKLLKQGVRDMVRISDARMSGTSYGACILHVAPEAYVGGPLAAVRDGDIIALDVACRTLTLEVASAEIERRLSEWRPPERDYSRGFLKMHAEHIQQAPEGCDFTFLQSPHKLPEPEIH